MKEKDEIEECLFDVLCQALSDLKAIDKLPNGDLSLDTSGRGAYEQAAFLLEDRGYFKSSNGRCFVYNEIKKHGHTS